MSVPARGDLVVMDFDPQAGHEQAGRRPAIVLSELAFNQLTGFAVMCPITSNAKNYPFEVTVPEGLPVSGVVLTDQLKSLDYIKRRVRIIGSVQPEHESFLKAVLRNARAILA
ncbi:type II toxin-antitoxin system PemK/MazF family toxin [Cohnella luojiensis]|uniref:mRNA-degrading endonuclease n=1 Tax=Cohnella luojiensis TaxID=652876 RepID=A0A4Y8M1S0_9BACL|nr:type II toxin-antitoxin system PemK/MazF family toxin [Cohnella luojiensis]TFE29057.1 mRNA-degrading endonuclease [Cohnella luojiensis]